MLGEKITLKAHNENIFIHNWTFIIAAKIENLVFFPYVSPNNICSL